jgi:hypothetical protein
MRIFSSNVDTQTMKRHSQKTIENLYSQRNIKAVLFNAVKDQMDKLLLNWSLRSCFQILEYLNKEYHPSKETRIQTLKEQIKRDGLEKLVIQIAVSVLHSHQQQTIQQCVGYLQAALDHNDHFDRVQTAAELLAVCSSDKGFYSINRKGSGYSTWIIVNYWPLIDSVMLDQFEWINDTIFNPPLLEPPKQVTDNSNCGYHTFNEPLILGTHTQHDGHQDYDSINILNGIPWVLDWDVLAEPETTPAELNTPKKQQEFVEHVRQSECVYALLNKRSFHLAWQPDSRGRIYSHGYHVNFQSHEYKKAMLSFDHYEVCT